MMPVAPIEARRTDFSCQAIELGGATLLADASGALWWPAEGALLVADLHFEKASAHALRGSMLPPYDTRETLDRLSRTVRRYRPRTVIALGDSIHDRHAPARFGPAELAALRDLQDGRSWIWITGNHDPEIAPALGGDAMPSLALKGITLCHVPRQHPEAPEIAGHLHPVARAALSAGSIRRPCFVGDGTRLILPAFGAFTGGLNVLDDAFAPLLRQPARMVWMLGRDGVYPVPGSALQPD